MQNAVTACAIAAAGIAMGSVAGDANAPLAPYACLPIPAALQETPPQSLDAEQRALAAHLSRRFFVAQSEAGRFVAVAYRAAQEVGLDPLLVLAVIAVESRFNPIAESVAGAKGLMQIIPRYHHAKLERYGGEQAVLDPESNILVGTRILQEYVHRTGTLEAGLQFYNGAMWDASARYSRKVLAEQRRLETVLRDAAGPGAA